MPSVENPVCAHAPLFAQLVKLSQSDQAQYFLSERDLKPCDGKCFFVADGGLKYMAHMIRFRNEKSRSSRRKPTFVTETDRFKSANTKSIGAAFESLETIDSFLEDFWQIISRLPDSVQKTKLIEERSSLVCSVFAVKLDVVRLSSSLAEIVSGFKEAAG